VKTAAAPSASMDSKGTHSCRRPGARPLGRRGIAREKRAEMDTPTPMPDDFLTPELARLLGTARQVIDEHVNDHATARTAG